MAASPIVTCPNCATKNRIRASAEGTPKCAVCGHALPWIVDADPARFDEELKATVPVLVDFWAPWCGPCRAVSPAVERVATHRAGQMKVVKLNIDTAPGIATRHDVQGIPLLVVFRDGEEVDRLAGAVSAAALEQWIEPRLATAP
jgi:thioredoxin 2